MAATTELNVSIARDLLAVRGKIAALPRIAWRLTSEESPYTPDQRSVEQADLEVEWRDIVDRLAWLHELYGAASMCAEQAAEYERLLEIIPAALPIITRLQLDLPPAGVLRHTAAGQATRRSDGRAP